MFLETHRIAEAKREQLPFISQRRSLQIHPEDYVPIFWRFDLGMLIKYSSYKYD